MYLRIKIIAFTEAVNSFVLEYNNYVYASLWCLPFSCMEAVFILELTLFPHIISPTKKCLYRLETHRATSALAPTLVTYAFAKYVA